MTTIRRRLSLDPLESRETPSFGTPTFVPFDSATASNALYAADMDKNGRADLVANVRAEMNARVYRDDGTIGEDDYTGQMFNLVPGDFTNDGNPDVLLQIDSITLRLERGDGLGGLTADPDPIPTNVIEVQAWLTADVDADGNLDVVVGSQTAVHLLYGNGAGGFTSQSLPFGANAFAPNGRPPVAADLTGDGVMDLAFPVATFDPVTGTTSNAVHVLLGDGARGFAHAPFSPLAITATDLVAGNFSGDARTDLAVFGNNGVQVLRATAAGFTPDAPTVMPAGTFSPPTAALPGPNGYHRLVVTSSDFGNGEVWFTTYTGSATGLAGRQESNHLPTLDVRDPAVGDFNGDGRADLAVASAVSGTAGVYYFLAGDAPPPPVAGGLTWKDAHRVTFTDVDGDAVTVTSSKPIFTGAALGNVVKLSAAADPNQPRQQLQKIDLSVLADPFAARGTILTVSATKNKATGGDGKVNVGRVEGSVDLAAVIVKGDLGAVLMGDLTTTTPGLLLLDVGSLGVRGTATQAAGGDLNSTILGGLGAVNVAGDVRDAHLFVTGVNTAADGYIGAVIVRGSVFGGAADYSGSIEATGAVYLVRLGTNSLTGHLWGGAGASSGVIQSGGAMTAVTLSDIQGDAGDSSGSLFAGGALGKLTVRENITSRSDIPSGQSSGRVYAAGPMKSLTVGGSIGGGTGENSGVVIAAGGLDTANVAAVVGGPGPTSGRLSVTGRLGTLKMKTGVNGGDGPGSGYVRADALGTLQVTVGSIRGGAGTGSGTVAVASLDKATFDHKGEGVIGGTGPSSGRLAVRGWLKSLTLNHVYGWVGAESGGVAAGSIGTVTVRRNVEGGAGFHSGCITSDTDVTSVTVNGNVFGGSGDRSGRVESIDGGIDKVSVTGMVVAGLGTRSGNLSAVRIDKFTIGNGMFGDLGRESGVVEVDYAPDRKFTVAVRPRRAPTPAPVQGGTPLPPNFVASGLAAGLSSGTIPMAAGEVISRGGGTVISRGAGS